MVMTAEVIRNFVITSICMWTFPVAIIYAVQHNLLPGFEGMSPYSKTLSTGFFAVISVVIISAVYIYMAMKEPSDRHQPEHADAKSSLNQSKPVEVAERPSDVRDKQE